MKMAEYIEREALLQDIEDSVRFSARTETISPEMWGANKTVDRIKCAPVADVEPVRHGHWSEADNDGEYTCSHCGWVGRITCLGKDKIWSGDIEYCPYCGAKMDEEVSE